MLLAIAYSSSWATPFSAIAASTMVQASATH
jgi:hypothetical protein